MDRAKTQENYIERLLEDADMDTLIQIAREGLEHSVASMTDEDLSKTLEEFGYEDCIE